MNEGTIPPLERPQAVSAYEIHPTDLSSIQVFRSLAKEIKFPPLLAYLRNGPDTMMYIPKSMSPIVHSCAIMFTTACWLPPP